MTREVVRRAAIDLGSNSFQLLIQEKDAVRTQTVERMRQKVQLAHGFESGLISDAAIERGLDCIARFAQRLLAIDRENIYIAGTYVLRNAENASAFVNRAEQLLGCTVHIISGEDEARLIYFGAVNRMLSGAGGKLVVDIGGGSTELAFGRSNKAERLQSLDVGCVDLMDRFYKPGHDGATAFRQATNRATEFFSSVDVALINVAGVEVVGTSGTMESIQNVLAANGWGSTEISSSGLEKLALSLLDKRWVTGGSIPGLEPERVDIFPAGVAILCALFKQLKIKSLHCLDASLLDGLLTSEGRDFTFNKHNDATAVQNENGIQARSISGLMQRYAVDEQQVGRVSRAVSHLLAGVSGLWGIDNDESKYLLTWAAELHEIGIQIAARNYHRHGAYIIQHSEIPGLSRRMKSELALLVRNHRRGFKTVAFSAYSEVDGNRLKRLSVLIRIAVIIERSRCDKESPVLEVVATKDGIRLIFQADWLDSHALSRDELTQEKAQLSKVGISLEF